MASGQQCIGSIGIRAKEKKCSYYLPDKRNLIMLVVYVSVRNSIEVKHYMKKGHWISCPHCHLKTTVKIYEDIVLLNFPLHCDNCNKETIINIVKLKMVQPESPNSKSK